jgi:hypothetical protein
MNLGFLRKTYPMTSHKLRNSLLSSPTAVRLNTDNEAFYDINFDGVRSIVSPPFNLNGVLINEETFESADRSLD